MRAAVFRQGKILVDTVSDPKPSEGQVLVRTCACGICGSDLHAAKHTNQFVNLAKRAGNRWAMDADRDVVFGHEFCCEILEYGPRTPARLAPGTLVCSMPMTLADKTVQGIGYSNEIAGGFAAIHAAGRQVASAGAERPAGRTGRPDRADCRRLACRPERSACVGRSAYGRWLRPGWAGGDRRARHSRCASYHCR